MIRDANLSPDRMYRYRLFRSWGGGGGKMITFIMLNPSTADETEDDATIRRCIGFAEGWGFNALQVLNLFAYRTKYPAEMMQAEDPVGPKNDTYLGLSPCYSSMIIAAWGNPGAYMGRALSVRNKIRPLYCLGTNQDGSPKHPLYLKKDTLPEVYSL